MHKVLINRLGGLGLLRKSVVRLTDRPDMNLDVYRGRKTKHNNNNKSMLQTQAIDFYHQQSAGKSSL